MKANWRQLRLLFALLPPMALVATFGFWGEQFTSSVSLPSLPDAAEEAWLAEPIAAVTVEGDLRGLAGVGGPAFTSGPNPFLTAAEDGGRARGGSRGPVVRVAKGSQGWPELRAVISLGGEDLVLLNSSSVRVGEKAEGYEILEVTGHHVLVKGEEGRKWLHLSAP